MTDLSPAAQAVMDAANSVRIDVDWWPEGMSEIIAAALRVAADLVVPDDHKEATHFTREVIRLSEQSVRHQLLAIAAELDGGAR
jgi:hypothetical protein